MWKSIVTLGLAAAILGAVAGCEYLPSSEYIASSTWDPDKQQYETRGE